jgi:hypothetical protein
MPRDDHSLTIEPVTLPPNVRLLLHLTALSLRIKAKTREIAELNARVAQLEAARET